MWMQMSATAPRAPRSRAKVCTHCRHLLSAPDEMWASSAMRAGTVSARRTPSPLILPCACLRAILGCPVEQRRCPFRRGRPSHGASSGGSSPIRVGRAAPPSTQTLPSPRTSRSGAHLPRMPHLMPRMPRGGRVTLMSKQILVLAEQRMYLELNLIVAAPTPAHDLRLARRAVASSACRASTRASRRPRPPSGQMRRRPHTRRRSRRPKERTGAHYGQRRRRQTLLMKMPWPSYGKRSTSEERRGIGPKMCGRYRSPTGKPTLSATSGLESKGKPAALGTCHCPMGDPARIQRRVRKRKREPSACVTTRRTMPPLMRPRAAGSTKVEYRHYRPDLQRRLCHCIRLRVRLHRCKISLGRPTRLQRAHVYFIRAWRNRLKASMVNASWTRPCPHMPCTMSQMLRLLC
mmetsp:Transcript_30653/g.93787  ORF Transcript_30653/g.93787 Transcript_30653/m.93787 type:complete len:405 (-) Transcript_30653:3069-4283(-)